MVGRTINDSDSSAVTDSMGGIVCVSVFRSITAVGRPVGQVWEPLRSCTSLKMHSKFLAAIKRAGRYVVWRFASKS